MGHLSLSFLGPFQVTLAGQPVAGFVSNRVRALLAYLAVEVDRPHPRETLAGLIWGGWPNSSALTNLRHALANLRRVIGDAQASPPFLLISRETIRLNPASDYALDVAAFAELVATAKASRASVISARAASSSSTSSTNTDATSVAI